MISRFKLSLNVSSSTKSKNKHQGHPTPDVNPPHQFPEKGKRTGPFSEQMGQKEENGHEARPPQVSPGVLCPVCGSTLVSSRGHIGSTLQPGAPDTPP